jgi:hypothetical protein
MAKDGCSQQDVRYDVVVESGREEMDWVGGRRVQRRARNTISNWERGLVQAGVDTSCMRIMRLLEGSNFYSCLRARAAESILGVREERSTLSSNSAECQCAGEEASTVE